jgi:ADP-heptose:LPS heptosyltransferase
LSIIPFFDKVKRGEIPYNNSSFILNTVASTERFDLPDRYVTLCPFSNDKRLKTRDFNGDDWAECLKFLKKVDAPGVVLNAGNDHVPTAPNLINLTNGTDITEAVEILKKGFAYLGIDSALSVLAAKLFSPPNLMIKSNNEHCYVNLQCYYAPHSEFSFVVRNIKCPEDLYPNTNRGNQ